MPPDPFLTVRWRPFAWLALGASLLSACASAPPGPQTPADTASKASASVAAPIVVVTAPPPSESNTSVALPTAQPQPPASSPVAEADAGIAALFRYADRLRMLSAGELTAEIAASGEPGPSVQRQMQLALALMHTHQPVDTAKALGLLQRVAAGNGDDGSAVRPLARLLAGRLLEQRKLEDASDRQAQQLRDQQRRIEQLTDRLEAMRAIERSLNARPPAAPRSTPGGTTP